jgi:hypothetical protein
VAWFNAGSEADPSACLALSPALAKAHRAAVHAAAEGEGARGLTTVSSGVGAARRVAVVRRGSPAAEAAQAGVSAEVEERAAWLWRWAQEEGVEVSRDEAAEALAAGEAALAGPLAELWARRAAQQAGAEALCAAATTGDAAAVEVRAALSIAAGLRFSRLHFHRCVVPASAGVDRTPGFVFSWWLPAELLAAQAVLAACPGLAAAGPYDARTNLSPLALAAGEGHVAVVEALLAAGFPVDARDGAGATALQVARKYERGDAEGALLRAGAAEGRAEGARWRREPAGAGGSAAAAAAPAEVEAAAAEEEEEEEEVKLEEAAEGAQEEEQPEEQELAVPAPEAEVEIEAEAEAGAGAGAEKIEAGAEKIEAGAEKIEAEAEAEAAAEVAAAPAPASAAAGSPRSEAGSEGTLGLASSRSGEAPNCAQHRACHPRRGRAAAARRLQGAPPRPAPNTRASFALFEG